jgi:hypothetical protein
MVCDHADTNCPVIFGARKRFSLPYKDPKRFDGSEYERRGYIDSVLEIGSEIYYLLRYCKE